MWERQVLCHTLCENGDKEDGDGEVGVCEDDDDKDGVGEGGEDCQLQRCTSISAEAFQLDGG